MPVVKRTVRDSCRSSKMEDMANENGYTPMDGSNGDAQVPYGDAANGANGVDAPHTADAHNADGGVAGDRPEYGAYAHEYNDRLAYGAYADPRMSDDERYPFGKPEEPQQTPAPGAQYPAVQGNPNAQPNPNAQYNPYADPTNRQRYQNYEQRYGTPEGNGYDGMCIAGFVMSLIIPLFGLIFSIVGLVNVRRTGKRGKGLAIAGIIISALSMLLSYYMLATGMMQHILPMLA